MISRAYITAWRANTPWSTDAQVEQDLVLSRALVEIFSDPLLRAQLAFRGGTALYKLYLVPPRYSEDNCHCRVQKNFRSHSPHSPHLPLRRRLNAGTDSR